MEPAVEIDHPLSAGFGPVTLTLAGVGAVVGAGIFVITGQAAALYAGPAVILSFVVAGLVCAFSALCYAELSAMMPVAGSAYRFSRVAFGEIPGWIVGWALVAEYLFALGAVAIGWSAYMQDFIGGFGLHLPARVASSPIAMSGHRFTATGAIVNLPAVLLIAAVAAVLLLGTRKSARINGAMVAIKVSAVVLFILFGLAFSHARNWLPFIPDRAPGPGGVAAYGISGVFQAAGVVFFAFLGFDGLSTAAQETHNPQRNMPLAILGTLIISLVLYVGVSAAMTGLADFHTLDTAAPLTAALAAGGSALGWLKTYVGVCATIGLVSGVWAALFALSRLLFGLAGDRLLPAALGRTDRNTKVPRAAIVVGAGCGVIVAGFLPINLLGELISTGTLIAFATVCAAVMALRMRAPERHRPFSVPFWRVTPVLGILSCLFILGSMGLPALSRIVLWQVAGLVVFAAVTRSRRVAAAAA
ncbi:MAG TPA: amino acid permease [Alphaproteobacteria bacterium]|nr:amino acid permease [Alphaproteobacteria bacterium]